MLILFISLRVLNPECILKHDFTVCDPYSPDRCSNSFLGFSQPPIYYDPPNTPYEPRRLLRPTKTAVPHLFRPLRLLGPLEYVRRQNRIFRNFVDLHFFVEGFQHSRIRDYGSDDKGNPNFFPNLQ